MPLKLLIGIRHFKNHQLEKDKDLLASLSKGQSPDVVFITCSDSRIRPHLFTHSGLGSIFMGRNPGNIVPPIDSSQEHVLPSGEAATVEYALASLNVSEIIVCGHSGCGAMKGLLTDNLAQTLPLTAAWLKPAHILVKDLELRHPEAAHDPLLKLRCLTQDNILLQIQHLKTNKVVRERLEAGNLKIHGWYYDIGTGEVYIYSEQKRAFVPFEETVEALGFEKLNSIVAEETINFFKNNRIASAEQFTSLQKLYREVRFTGISPIWKEIALKVETQLQKEIGELYRTKEGSMSPLLELLKKGPAIRLSETHLKKLDELFKKFPFINSEAEVKENYSEAESDTNLIKDKTLSEDSKGVSREFSTMDGYQYALNVELDLLKTLHGEIKQKLIHNPNYKLADQSMIELMSELDAAQKVFFAKPSKHAFEQFSGRCSTAISSAMRQLEQHRGTWYQVPSLIRGLLGILALVSVIPAILVSCLAPHGYDGTFFTPPKTASAKSLEHYETCRRRWDQEAGQNLELQPSMT